MMDKPDTPAKNTKTGINPSAKNPSASRLEHALQTSLAKHRHRAAARLDPQDVHARLILIIGSTLALVFLIVSVGVTYALIFVTQPIGGQAPNDAAFIDLLKTLAIFLTGSLGGVLAGNGLKAKEKKNDTQHRD
jgi:hypothetical protein